MDVFAFIFMFRCCFEIYDWRQNNGRPPVVNLDFLMKNNYKLMFSTMCPRVSTPLSYFYSFKKEKSPVFAPSFFWSVGSHHNITASHASWHLQIIQLMPNHSKAAFVCQWGHLKTCRDTIPITSSTQTAYKLFIKHTHTHTPEYVFLIRIPGTARELSVDQSQHELSDTRRMAAVVLKLARK